VLVGDRERIAVHPVAGPEVALEVRGPQVVGRVRHRRHHAWMVVWPAAPALLHQTPTRQEVARGAGGGPVDVRGSARQPLQEHARPPARVRLARRADLLRHVRGNAVWAVVRRAATIAQRGSSALLHTVDPLVAGFSAHVVPRTQIGHGVEVQPVVGDEAFAFVHGCSLQPRHACPRGKGLPWSSVTHVPGLECHLCTRSVPAAA